MKRLFKPKKQEEKISEIRKKFEELKQTPVGHATTRIVNVKKIVGCGCGGEYEWFHGEVPIDSDIEDGDYVDHFRGITNIEKGRTDD